MHNDDKQLAKQIILEIIRQAGGVLKYKTRLYKAFYYAHLRFADTQPGYLSTWPIVRMPRGPGIHHFKDLILELVAEKKIDIQIIHGKHKGYVFNLLPCELILDLLPKGAGEAIAFGVQQIEGRTPTQTSEDSHLRSRAWGQAKDGEELNIYLDSLSEEEYQKNKKKAEELGVIIDSIWDERSTYTTN
jgi:hypothetical protein